MGAVVTGGVGGAGGKARGLGKAGGGGADGKARGLGKAGGGGTTVSCLRTVSSSESESGLMVARRHRLGAGDSCGDKGGAGGATEQREGVCNNNNNGSIGTDVSRKEISPDRSGWWG
jgi:hypothetical protein